MSHSTIVRVPSAAQLQLGETKVFFLPDSEEQGFVIGTRKGLRAYRNRCCHWPCPLDMEDGEFVSPLEEAIVCKLHGASYGFEDGICSLGPCRGAVLKSYPVEVDGTDALVEVPGEQ